jgi:hypothetical protein
MRTVSALFKTYDQVATAVDGLSEMGVPSGGIAVVSQRHGTLIKFMEGAGLGAAIGGVAGLLAGFGMFFVPGLGLMVGGFGWMAGIGWLIPLMIGAAAGGIGGAVIASFANTRADACDTLACAEAAKRGGTLLVVNVHDDEVGKARSILLRCGAIGTNARRGEYAPDGWDGFVSKDIWDEDIGSEEERLPGGRAADDDTGSDRRYVA